MACLVTIVLTVGADLTPASGAVVPECDPVAPRFSHPICGERIVDGLGDVVDLAVTDSGDLHVLGGDGMVTVVRPGSRAPIAVFELPGALMLEAGYRSLLVGTADGVTRHRIARGEVIPGAEGQQIMADRPSTLALARLGRLFAVVPPADCDGGCDEIRVFDALDPAPSFGRSTLRTDGDVRALAALPGRDLVFGLVVSADGDTELMPIGDHHGGCVGNECVATTIPTSADPSGMVMVPKDLFALGLPTALVTAGPEVWGVAIDGSVPVSVERLTNSAGAAFEAAVDAAGAVYLADTAVGTIWRLWGER